MTVLKFAYQPTLRQLLKLEALSESHVICGEDWLDRPVAQVVSYLNPPPRAGSLVVANAELFTGAAGQALPPLTDLTGIVLVVPTGSHPSSGVASSGSSAAQVQARAPAPALVTSLSIAHDVSLQRLAKSCQDSEVPLVLVPSFGENANVVDEVRLAFLRELKTNSSRLHSELINLVLEEGLDGLVEQVSLLINRPLAVETVDFKVLASKNMGATPAGQQSGLTEASLAFLKNPARQKDKNSSSVGELKAIRIGRRMVLPIFLNELMVGFISAMVKPTDDLDSICEYLFPAALAAKVDFSHRQKDGPGFAVTQRSLLKDLLSGRGVSAADQERLERHYGFDLSDGLLVFAVEVTAVQPGTPKIINWTDESLASTEVEGTTVFIVPYLSKEGRTWQKEAEALVGRLKSQHAQEGHTNFKAQVGAARLTQTMIDLPDAYREARQALIIGSMIHGENDFIVGYGDLGVKRLLYLIIDHPELERFYEEHLAPLEAYDVEWESELVSTLRGYLEQGANLNSAARALFIHRHTLRYRLEQIADILKVDIDSQEVLLNLQIAFLIKDLRGEMRGRKHT